MWVSKELVLQSLDELSDVELQRDLWLSDGSSGRVSSFIEAFESLFTDSNLATAIDTKYPVYPKAVMRELAELRRQILELHHAVSDEALIIDSPLMVTIRIKAKDLARQISFA